VSDDVRSMATAHRILAGVSLLAIVLALVGSVASLIEIISAPGNALRWAAAAVLVAVSLCWLVAVVNGSTRSRPNRALGYVSAAMLIAGAALAGWNVHALTPRTAVPVPEPKVSVSTATVRGIAVIDRPATGAKVESCMVDVRFHGRPGPGKKFVVAARHATQGYFFETDLVDDPRGDVWTASVQAGEKDLDRDKRYTVSVFEFDRQQVDYLIGVVSLVAGESTYWPSSRQPPDTPGSLDSIVIERFKPDPLCES
jgi:hypothetical protein